eukprot:IDg20149t1
MCGYWIVLNAAGGMVAIPRGRVHLYEYYMSEAMLAPSVQDWQIFLSEYAVMTVSAWLYAIYNDYRVV